MKVGYRFADVPKHPEWTEIMLDYDVKDWRRCTKRISPWLDYLRPHVKECDIRKTRKGYHVRIWIDLELEPRRLNDLQAGMGDDGARVRMNERRIRKGIVPWNRLWLVKFKLDGTIISREEEAPGCTKQLRELLFPSDSYFVRERRMR